MESLIHLTPSTGRSIPWSWWCKRYFPMTIFEWRKIKWKLVFFSSIRQLSAFTTAMGPLQKMRRMQYFLRSVVTWFISFLWHGWCTSIVKKASSIAIGIKLHGRRGRVGYDDPKTSSDRTTQSLIRSNLVTSRATANLASTIKVYVWLKPLTFLVVDVYST